LTKLFTFCLVVRTINSELFSLLYSWLDSSSSVLGIGEYTNMANSTINTILIVIKMIKRFFQLAGLCFFFIWLPLIHNVFKYLLSHSFISHMIWVKVIIRKKFRRCVFKQTICWNIGYLIIFISDIFTQLIPILNNYFQLFYIWEMFAKWIVKSD